MEEFYLHFITKSINRLLDQTTKGMHLWPVTGVEAQIWILQKKKKNKKKKITRNKIKAKEYHNIV